MKSLIQFVLNMDPNTSQQFITSLAKNLQTLCNSCVKFNDWVQVSGNLVITIESGNVADFVVNEKLNKQDDYNYSVTSKSIHTLFNKNLSAGPFNSKSNALKKTGSVEGEDSCDETEVACLGTSFDGLETEREEFLSRPLEIDIKKGERKIEIPSSSAAKMFEAQSQSNPFDLSSSAQEDLGDLPDLKTKDFLKMSVKRELPETKAISGNFTERITKNILNQLGLNCLVQLEKSVSIDSTDSTKKGITKSDKKKEKAVKDPGNHKCDICNKILSNRNQLISHLSSHTASFSCKFCQKTFSQKHNKDMHVKTHTEERPYTCDQCPKSYKDKKSLRDHRRIHTGERPFQCEKCGAAFSTRTAFRKHVKNHDQSQLAYECLVCHKRYLTPSHLKVHMRKHTGEKPFTCEICGTSFSSNNNLFYHRKIHSGEIPFQCDQCPKGYMSRSSLNEHKQTHLDVERQMPFICEVCQKGFSHRYKLNAHLQRHSSDRPFKCGQCNMAFKKKDGLTQHKLVHQESRNFVCDFCPKSFKTKSDLRRHKNIHLGIEPYKCEECGKKFVHQGSYKIHLRHHSGERPYKCKFCPQAFIRSERLRDHERTHTGEKSHKCDLCGKFYPSKGAVNKHKKKVHSACMFPNSSGFISSNVLVGYSATFEPKRKANQDQLNEPKAVPQHHEVEQRNHQIIHPNPQFSFFTVNPHHFLH